MTYDVRSDQFGFMARTLSYCLAILAPGSAATGNLPEHFSVSAEKLASLLRLPAVTPMSVAPAALNWSDASANIFASMLHPWVSAAGKKYSTTGPFLRASAIEKWSGLPAW